MNRSEINYLEESPANLIHETVGANSVLGYEKFRTSDGDYEVFVQTDNLDSSPWEYPVTVEGPTVELDSDECGGFGELLEGYADISLDPVDCDLVSKVGHARKSYEPGAEVIGKGIEKTDRDEAGVQLAMRKGFDDIREANHHVNKAIGCMEDLYEEAREELSQ